MAGMVVVEMTFAGLQLLLSYGGAFHLDLACLAVPDSLTFLSAAHSKYRLAQDLFVRARLWLLHAGEPTSSPHGISFPSTPSRRAQRPRNRYRLPQCIVPIRGRSTRGYSACRTCASSPVTVHRVPLRFSRWPPFSPEYKRRNHPLDGHISGKAGD